MVDLGDLFIGGVPVAALVVGLVSLAKQLGMPVKYAPYLNGSLATIGFVMVAWLLPAYPDIGPYLKLATGAIVVFLTASGIYQFGKTSNTKESPPHA